jgi:hypothetical protein
MGKHGHDLRKFDTQILKHRLILLNPKWASSLIFQDDRRRHLETQLLTMERANVARSQ